MSAGPNPSDLVGQLHDRVLVRNMPGEEGAQAAMSRIELGTRFLALLLGSLQNGPQPLPLRGGHARTPRNIRGAVCAAVPPGMGDIDPRHIVLPSWAFDPRRTRMDYAIREQSNSRLKTLRTVKSTPTGR